VLKNNNNYFQGPVITLTFLNCIIIGFIKNYLFIVRINVTVANVTKRPFCLKLTDVFVCLRHYKHRVREIVFPVPRGKSGNTYFEAMSTKIYFYLPFLVRQTIYSKSKCVVFSLFNP
jgi:hypothetical protein